MQTHDRLLIHSSAEANWRTPEDCFGRLHQEARFAIDLAAAEDSTLCPTWLGPGSREGTDALVLDWYQYRDLGPGFLNPPFSKTLANAYRTGRIKNLDGHWQPHEVDYVKATWYEIENWARKCWQESQRGFTIYAVLPFAPQTDWYRQYVYGHGAPSDLPLMGPIAGMWSGHAAMEERRLPHRISFLRPDGTSAANAGVNSVVIIWRPNPGYVGPWQPAVRYWSYR